MQIHVTFSHVAHPCVSFHTCFSRCCSCHVVAVSAQVIRTTPTMRKPPGILWHKLSPEKLGQIRVLQELKSRIEKETGQKLPEGEGRLGERGGRLGTRTDEKD